MVQRHARIVNKASDLLVRRITGNERGEIENVRVKYLNANDMVCPPIREHVDG